MWRVSAGRKHFPAQLSACFIFAALMSRQAYAELPVVNPGVQIPAPATMRAVEVGRFSSANEANALVAELTNKGYAPVWQRTREDQTIQVLVGKCAYLADATSLRISLRAHGYRDAAERTYRDLEGLGSFSDPAMPEDNLLYPKQPPVPSTTVPAPQPLGFESSMIPSSFQNPAAPTSEEIATSTTLMNAAISEGRFSEAARLGLAITRTLPDSNPAKGALLTGSSRNFVRGENKAAPVIENFIRVARGEVAATPEKQLEARWLAADSWHYYFVKPLKARIAYKEILEHHSESASVRARAMVEIVACMLELARSEQATFEEVRRSCQELRATVPNSYQRAHALADLIEGESYFYDNKFEEAATAFSALLQNHPTRIREGAMARMFLGDTALKTGSWETAKAHYEAVLAYDLSDPAENFYWQGKQWDLKKRAADNLAFKAREQGDTQTAEAHSEHEPSQNEIPTNFDAAFPHSFYEMTEE